MYLNPPYAIESVPSSSGHAIAYRWHSLPRVRRHRAVNLKIVPVTGAAFAVTTMCVSVFFSFILDIKFVGRTSRGHTGGRSHRRKVTQEEGHTGGRSHRRKVTQEEGHTGFPIHLLSAVRAFISLAKRIQSFLSLVDREVEF